MKSIPNISLNENKINELITRHKVTMGGEAIICESDNPYTLYKLFFSNNQICSIGDNKEKKVIELYQKDLDYSVKPVSTISLGDIIIGYEMTNEYDLETYKAYQLTREELLYFLKETRKILDYFESKGIIYGDLDFRNILFNRFTGEIKFCDMDNTQIGALKMDKLPFTLMEYEQTFGIDTGVHPYMHNYMTLRAFDLDPYFINTFDRRRLFDHQARRIISSMRNVKTLKKEYIIDHIKKS